MIRCLPLSISVLDCGVIVVLMDGICPWFVCSDEGCGSDSNRNVDAGGIYLHRDDCMEGLMENMTRVRERTRMKIPKEENGACEERASKQAKQSKAKQVPSASWYWTKDLPDNRRLQRLSRGAWRVEAGR